MRRCYRCDCGNTIVLNPREIAPDVVTWDTPCCARCPDRGEMARVPHDPPLPEEAELVEYMKLCGLLQPFLPTSLTGVSANVDPAVELRIR